MHYKSILIYGFAIFAMFFGSGNLVFPLQVGLASGDSWLFGFIGLFLTGILLPFLGLMVIKMYRGSYTAFFAEGGTLMKHILPLFTLSLLGSFGIVPRCITVAHGSLAHLFPALPLFLFSFLFCGLTYFLCLRDSTMVQIIGKWLSPIKFSALMGLILMAFWSAPYCISDVGAKAASTHGFLMGYQTMDLFAAFFFSALIFSQIEKSLPSSTSQKDIIKFAIKPSIIGASLIAIAYFGFVFLGSHYATILSDVSPELYLPTIAHHTMGNAATLFIAFAMPLSCLTTAVALNNIYARYICTTLRLESSKFPFILSGTTAMSFAISLLDFKGIAAFLAPMLQMSYPGLIALTILSLITYHYKKLKIILFYGITLFTALKVFL